MFPKVSPLRWSRVGRLRLGIPTLLVLVWLAIALGSGYALLHAQRESRQQIETRFQARGVTNALFVQTYVRDFGAAQQRIAEHELTERAVSTGAFARARALFGSDNAAVLDAAGRALSVQPANRGAIGDDLAAGDQAVAAALGGQVGVSNAIDFESGRVPVIEFAVPFQSPFGRRVFTTAYPLHDTPLAAYIRNAGAVKPNHVYLLDGAGAVIASNADDQTEARSLSAEEPELARAVGTSSQPAHGTTTGDDYFAVNPVAGTPWRLVSTAPESTLFQAIRGSKRWIPWVLWLGFVAAGLATIVLVRRLVASRRELRRFNAELDRLARVDALTGLPNRRSIEELLQSTVASAGRHRHDAAVLMIDVDHFKHVNDNYGHAVGDEVLIALGALLHEHVRDADVVGRWGGEEFLVVLPFTDSAGAEIVAERLREIVAETPVTAGGEPMLLTVSLGCAALRADEELSALLHRTDAALYQAKERGRNRVVTAEAPRYSRNGASDDLPAARGTAQR